MQELASRGPGHGLRRRSRGHRLAVLAALLAAFAAVSTGCGGPSYAGGPAADEPHGVVVPGLDVTLWTIDGHRAASGPALVEPGRRLLRVRIEFPMESDSPTPYEYRDLGLDVEAGARYRLDREEGIYPPYDVVVTTSRSRP